MALALVALVLIAMNTFVFSMGELWGRNNDLRLFEQHVRAVTRFLEGELRAAGLPPSSSGNDATIAPREVRAQSGATDNLLTFELREGSRLIAWPERPLPEVICSLAVRPNEGLVLLWRSRLEKDFPDMPSHETLVSPLVTAIAYDYYDPDFRRWETETALRKAVQGKLETPARLRLTFTYRNLKQESLLAVPVAAEGLPAN